MGEDLFARNAQGIGKLYHKVLLLMKILRTKPQVKNMNIKYYDISYTVIKNRDDKDIVNDEYENDYYNFNGIVPNCYVGRKNNNDILK